MICFRHNMTPRSRKKGQAVHSDFELKDQGLGLSEGPPGKERRDVAHVSSMCEVQVAAVS